jgi:hypothetical protein
VELKLKGTRHLLVYFDDVNMLRDNIDIIKNTETLIDASKEVGIEINAEKTKHMLLSRHQNVGQYRDIKIEEDRLKLCHSSNIWGRKEQIKI